MKNQNESRSRNIWVDWSSCFTFHRRRGERVPVISIGHYQDADARQRLSSRCSLGAEEAQAGVKELRIANCGFLTRRPRAPRR